MIHDGINETDDKIDSILMIGQSNMAGRGDFEQVAPISNPSCFMLRMGRWQYMSEPINPDRAIFKIRFHSGISLAASFADAYAKQYKRKVGLIPCADGGTTIAEWQPDGILFEHAVCMARIAMETSRLAGIIWHQGESDCTSDTLYHEYPEKFHRFFSALLSELSIDNIPIVIGELPQKVGDSWKLDGRNLAFNQRLPSLAAHYPRMAIASSEGLSMKPDGIHFDSGACREFGRRYFAAFHSVNH